MSNATDMLNKIANSSEQSETSEWPTAIDFVTVPLIETMTSEESYADESTSIDERALSNWSSHLYAEIHRAITKMAELPPDDALHLNKDAALHSISVLNFIKEHLKIDPPKIINQDNEALSFTWDFGDLKRYLTIDDTDIDIMHLSKRLKFRCEELVSGNNKSDFSNLVRHLGSEPRSSSTYD